MTITALDKEHYKEVAAIYKQGIETGIATFETKVPTWEQWDAKFLNQCRYVVILKNKVIAWCALSAISKRNVYKGVAENTIYVLNDYRGKGVGKELLEHLIPQSEKKGFWTLQAGMFTENIPSIKLHKQCGFREVGIRKKIGQLNGIWKDNLLMEYRSSKI